MDIDNIMIRLSKDSKTDKPEKPEILTKDMPSPILDTYIGKGKHVGIEDFEFEALWEFIFTEESGQCLKMMRDAFTLAKLTADDEIYARHHKVHRIDKKMAQDLYDKEMTEYLNGDTIEEDRKKLIKKIGLIKHGHECCSNFNSQTALIMLLYQMTNTSKKDVDPTYDLDYCFLNIDWDKAKELVRMASDKELKELSDSFIDWRNKCSMS